jgi:two-component sensor histidine kinase
MTRDAILAELARTLQERRASRDKVPDCVANEMQPRIDAMQAAYDLLVKGYHDGRWT